jgi:xylulokinase
MPREVVLAFDVGTSGVKAALVHAATGVLASRVVPLSLHTPRPGWVEQDPLEIRQGLVRAARGLLRTGGSSASDIVALAVTGQMFNVQPLDAQLTPLGPMISWLDQRATPQTASLARGTPPDRQFDTLGSVITAKDIVPRILWLSEADPERWQDTRWLVDCKEAVVAWLTGEVITDHSGASAYRLTDPRSGSWDPARAGLVGVPLERLPRIAPSTTVAGSLTKHAATALGVPAGVPVAVGAGDVPASQIGSGALDAGDAQLSLGTAVYTGITVDRPVADPCRRLGVLGHALTDAWILWLEVATGGAALRWIAGLLGDGRDADDPALSPAALERLAVGAGSDADELFFAPWLSGERVPVFDDSARAAFVGLSLRHSSAHLVRAVMEGVAYQIRWSWDYGHAYGVEMRSIRVVGGGGIGGLWLEIIASTLGRSLEVVASPQDAAALGAAATAFVAVGLWPDLHHVLQHVQVERIVMPELEAIRRHEERYARFRLLYDVLRPIHAGRAGAVPGTA